MVDKEYYKSLVRKMYNWDNFVADTPVEDLDFGDERLAELYKNARDSYNDFVAYVEKKAGI